MNPVPARGSILHNLYGLQPQKIDSAFEGLLDKEINISKALRTKASESQNHLRVFLSNENSRDNSFPRVLSNCDRDFLGGSFARHTKTWPLDDIDIYIPLDGGSLFYLSEGRRLPYTVQSDGTIFFNPLLSSRWTDGNYVSSSKLIAEFASVLRRHYPRETEVYPNGTCVSVRMSHGETQSSDGLGYDVVPCFSLKPDDANELEFYLMPNGFNGWMRTSPRLDTCVANLLQDFNGKLYRKVVKLIKYWNQIRFGAAFSSYYLELAISRVFWARRSASQPISSVSEGLAIGFEAVQNAYSGGNQTSWISQAPPVMKPSLSGFQTLTLAATQMRTALAWSDERTGREAEARQHWSQVFGRSL